MTWPRHLISWVGAEANAQYDPAIVTAFLAVYKSRGAEFFQNSASKVDRALSNAGIVKPDADIHYLKKSMLSTPIPNLQDNAQDDVSATQAAAKQR